MLTSNYTFAHALVGGILIGLGSLVAAGASGKIPGISGMFSRLLRPRAGDTAWRALFFVGLIGGAAAAFALVTPAANFRPVASLPLTVLAGLLVGFGTRLGGGCTSGYGVCGLGLGSKSALLATAAFMFSGIVTVFLIRHFGTGMP